MLPIPNEQGSVQRGDGKYHFTKNVVFSQVLPPPPPPPAVVNSPDDTNCLAHETNVYLDVSDDELMACIDDDTSF